MQPSKKANILISGASSYARTGRYRQGLPRLGVALTPFSTAHATLGLDNAAVISTVLFKEMFQLPHPNSLLLLVFRLKSLQADIVSVLLHTFSVFTAIGSTQTLLCRESLVNNPHLQ